MSTTVDKLSRMQVSLLGVVKEETEIRSPYRMWKQAKAWFIKYGIDCRVQVWDINGKLYKDLTMMGVKNGKHFMMNSVKETSRVNVERNRKK